MLKTFKNLSFRAKLFVTTMGISFLSSLLVSVAFISFDLYTLQTDITEQLQSAAADAADRTAVAVSLGTAHEEYAKSMLDQIAGSKYVVTKTIVLPGGDVFSFYTNPLLVDEPLLGNDSLFRRTIQSPIVLQEEILGTLIVEANLRPFILNRLRLQVVTAFAIALISMATSFLLTSVVLNIISKPVLQLAKTARHVTETQDFTIRVTKFAEDELGELTDQFNDMLATIEAQHVELVVVQNELEKRVRARTNHMLEEIRIRTEAESKAEAYNRESCLLI
ncbi:MAG: HAMP domain-containing protein [Candidatus Hydrogenedentota bacterium]